MDLTQLANLGEFVGGMAVVLTLAYLATQTRQARIAAEQSARFAGLQATGGVVSEYGRWRELATNQEIAGLIVKANADEDLSESEAIRLEAAFEVLFVTTTFSYMSSDSSGSLHANPVDVDYLAEWLRGNTGLVPIWNRKKLFSQGVAPLFVTSVDEMLAAPAD